MNVELKKWEFTYADDLEKYLNDIDIFQNMRESLPYPFLHPHARYYIEQRVFNGEEKQICRAIIVAGHAVGSVDIFIGDGVYSKSAELSIWIAKHYQNKGIASEAVTQICKFAFANYDIVRIYAKPYSEDVVCGKMLEKSGFQLEGTIRQAIFKDGKNYDYNMYSKIKS